MKILLQFCFVAINFFYYNWKILIATKYIVYNLLQQFFCCNKYGIWKVCRIFICIKELPSSTIHLKSLLRVCFSGCQWPSSSFDSMPTSQDPVGALLRLSSCMPIKDLDLRDYHLSAIPNDIGCLSLLNALRLKWKWFHFPSWKHLSTL